MVDLDLIFCMVVFSSYLHYLVCQSTLTLYLVLVLVLVLIPTSISRLMFGVFLNSLVCLFVCGFICDIATGHTNEATIMKFGMKDRCVKF